MNRKTVKRVALEARTMNRPGRGEGVRLEASFDTAAVSEAPKWVMVAKAGMYLGYLGGEQPFQFTQETFAQIVANVRSHPSFVAGDDGVGVADVVPWDFEHSSAHAATEGTLPTTGAPAQGWALDMEVRTPEGGSAELWALTRWLPLAKGYVKAGQYKWASVVVQFDTIHPVTGQNVGATISSIALTNIPFIEGMQQLAATKGGKGGKGQKVEARWYEPAESPMDAIRMMRSLFGLSETDGVDAVFNELSKVAAYVTGDAPLGVDVNDLVGSVRRILNLPALMPDAEAIATALTQLQQIVESDPSGLAPEQPTATMMATKENEIMDELIKKLAAQLGVRETESAVLSAIGDLVSLHGGLKQAFSLTAEVSADRIVALAKETVGARESLEGLFKALGVEDAAGSVDRIAELMKQAAELESVMPQLSELREEKAKRDEEAEESDVDAAIAANKMQPSMRDILLSHRKEVGHDKFVARFPIAPGAATHTAAASLVQPIATAPGGTQLSVSPDGKSILRAQPAGAPATAPTGDAIDLSMYPGPNKVAKIRAYLSATHPGYEAMPYDTKMGMAITLNRSGRCING